MVRLWQEKPYSVLEVVELLADNDIILSRHIESGKYGEYLHLVCFDGDYPDEGFRAAELVRRYGYPLACLRRVWDYDFDEEDDRCWEMTLYPTNL